MGVEEEADSWQAMQAEQYYLSSTTTLVLCPHEQVLPQPPTTNTEVVLLPFHHFVKLATLHTTDLPVSWARQNQTHQRAPHTLVDKTNNLANPSTGTF